MKTCLFIVTFRRDFEYLKFCLRSIAKFARGFSDVKILVPEQDKSLLIESCSDYKGSIPLTFLSGKEWEGKGFLWHECQIIRADEWCPDNDFIAHFDPDCVFTSPISPETFIKGGKPILRYEAFSSLGARHPGNLRWKDALDLCLPFECKYECMRGHPEVYHFGLYAKTRQMMEQRTGLPVDFYMKSCRNEFPQTVVDFPTLGAVAMQCFPEKYALFDCAKQPNPDFQPYPVIQFWSHNPPTVATDIWYLGRQQKIVPLEMCRKLGLV